MVLFESALELINCDSKFGFYLVSDVRSAFISLEVRLPLASRAWPEERVVCSFFSEAEVLSFDLDRDYCWALPLAEVLGSCGLLLDILVSSAVVGGCFGGKAIPVPDSCL